MTGRRVATGVGYVKEHRAEAKDPYTLAVILNLLAKVEKDGDTTAQAADALIATGQNRRTRRRSGRATRRRSRARTGKGADLETTGLAAYGLVQVGPQRRLHQQGADLSGAEQGQLSGRGNPRRERSGR